MNRVKKLASILTLAFMAQAALAVAPAPQKAVFILDSNEAEPRMMVMAGAAEGMKVYTCSKSEFQKNTVNASTHLSAFLNTCKLEADLTTPAKVSKFTDALVAYHDQQSYSGAKSASLAVGSLFAGVATGVVGISFVDDLFVRSTTKMLIPYRTMERTEFLRPATMIFKNMFSFFYDGMKFDYVYFSTAEGKFQGELIIERMNVISMFAKRAVGVAAVAGIVYGLSKAYDIHTEGRASNQAEIVITTVQDFQKASGIDGQFREQNLTLLFRALRGMGYKTWGLTK